MITPRTTRLLRVPDLRAMQRAIASRACTGVAARRCAVLVATRSAAEELRRTIESLMLGGDGASAVLLPDILPRAAFYSRLHERLPGAPPLLTEFEREVLLRSSARQASERGADAPFRLRPGLVVEMLAFYDELRRREQTIDTFDRKMTGTLEPNADTDRGAERMLRQTRFLSAAFAEFERRVGRSGRMDEHGLRALLLSVPVRPAYAHIVLAAADQAADVHGFWPVDFDLLARLPGLERLDVIATERLLAAGFHQRVHDALPGIEEEPAGSPSVLPALLAPEPPPGGEPVPWFTYRDREEELAGVARWIKSDVRRDPGAAALDRVAVVFQRPLPYLYLARQALGGAGVPYQALDALPLASEPFAAALDLLFGFVAAEGNRASVIQLLSSPHWSFADPEDDRRPLTRAHVAALDRVLRDVKYLGGWERLAALAAQAAERAASGGRRGEWGRAAPALRAAASAAAGLRAALDAPAASAQIDGLRRFIAQYERFPSASGRLPPVGSAAVNGDSWHARHLRARTAVVSALDALADAHARHDDEPVPIGELAGTIRRWIEGQTFAPRTGSHGLLLIDAAAAPFADVDRVRLVGLVESDWPERSRRSIFYPAALLSQLGWAPELERLAAARARFGDLLTLPARNVSVSTFTLEDDTIAAPSAFLEEVGAAGLAVERMEIPASTRVFVHEALADDPTMPAAVEGDAAAWLSLRQQRSPADAERYHGGAGVREPAPYAVSRLERYLDCPFKYFAAHVLALEEERDDESGLTPQERGQLLHTVFETFFAQWRAAGRGAVTADNIGDALAIFHQVAEVELGKLPETDRALERTYLLGSAAAAGLAERAFAFEIEQGIEVLERLLEHTLEGALEIDGTHGRRTVSLRAKADRIDLLEDSTLRVIDYKLGRAPKPSRALQLPVYGLLAEQDLEGRLGRSWTLSRAGYVAFKERNPFVPLGGSAGHLDKALAEGRQRLIEVVDGVEAGSFPPRPEEPWICTRCGYAMVCRKDYVGDE